MPLTGSELTFGGATQEVGHNMPKFLFTIFYR